MVGGVLSADFNIWYLRHTAPGAPRVHSVSAFLDDRFPDGTVVGEAEAGDVAELPRLWHVAADGAGRPVVTLSADVAPGAPPLWFVLMPDRRVAGQPRTVSMVGYATEHLPPGTVVDGPTFVGLPVRSAEQVGAVQWERDGGITRQLYVQPAWRRRHLALAIVYSAEAVHLASGWAGWLHGDGRRTDMGHAWVSNRREVTRVAPWTHRSTPMDPPTL